MRCSMMRMNHDASVFEDESRDAEVSVWVCAIKASPELQERRQGFSC